MRLASRALLLVVCALPDAADAFALEGAIGGYSDASCTAAKANTTIPKIVAGECVAEAGNAIINNEVGSHGPIEHHVGAPTSLTPSALPITVTRPRLPPPPAPPAPPLPLSTTNVRSLSRTSLRSLAARAPP